MKLIYSLLVSGFFGLILAGFPFFAPAQTIPAEMPKEPRAVAGSTPEQEKARIETLFADLEKSNHYTETFTKEDLNELPVGIKKKIGAVEYTVAIAKAVFYPDYAELTAYARINSLQGQDLLFGIQGLKFSYEGGIVGDARLILLSNIEFKLPGHTVKMILKGSMMDPNGNIPPDNTFITIDCEGYKELFVHGELELAGSFFIPCNAQGGKLPDSTATVKTAFDVQMTHVGDFLVNISLPCFQIKGLNDFVFSVRNAVFDFSDTRNDLSLRFPPGYENTWFTLPSRTMWQGIYIQEVEVMLPPMFQKRDSAQRLVIGSKDMLIDHNGVSGHFFAQGLLPFKDGSASGWPFSVDEFMLSLEAGQLTAAQFSGGLGIPVSKDTLRYKGLIRINNQYELTLAPLKNMTFDLWQAQVVLDNNSYITLETVENTFVPQAHLNGVMKLSVKNNPEDPSQKALTELNQIRFQDLHLQTHAPYIKVGYFGYEGDISIGNIPASITEISVSSPGSQILSFNIAARVSFMKDNFGAATRVGIESELLTQNDIQKWEFRRIRVDSINLNAEIAQLTLEGKLMILDNDPVYGNGFSGEIEADFKALSLKVNARALFGKIEEVDNYWFVHAKAEWGVPIGTGLINIQGFMGGAYYRMAREGNSERYIPDRSVGLGVRAGVLFNISSRTVADCMAEFEMAFRKEGGLRYISFFGSATMMGTLPIGNKLLSSVESFTNTLNSTLSSKLAGQSDAVKVAMLEQFAKERQQNPAKAAEENGKSIVDPRTISGLAAYIAMNYDFDNKVFHASFDTYVNVAGGLLKGANANGHAGTALIHLAPAEWYIHIGTPQQPMGVRMGIGELSIGSTAYFMVGTQIPDAPAPPQEVAQILDLSSYNTRNTASISEGKGFAFGSKFAINTGDITFLILYANLKAGLGFDFLLSEKKNTYCEGSSELVGINGWYAEGQVYAYLRGEIGVKVDLRFIKGRFPVIEGGVAALLQAKLPNPTFLKGQVGVEYNILKGLVKGKSKLELSFGNECKMITKGGASALEGLDIIADISPKQGSEADVFLSPQVAFNYAIDQEFKVNDEQNQEKTFIIQLDQFKLLHKGKPLEGSLQWNRNNDRVSYNTHEVLPPKSTLQLEVELSFKEYKNGYWQEVQENGTPVKEKRTLSFTTSDAPKEIPLHNIEYCYPVAHQQNYYPQESKSGYVQLKKGQSYLFSIQGQKQSLLLQPETGNGIFETNFSYNETEKSVVFNLPENLNPSTPYHLAIVSKLSDKALTSLSEEKDIQRTAHSEDEYTEIAQNKAQFILRTDIGTVLLTYAFRTSAYASFSQKIAQLKAPVGTWRILDYDLVDLHLSYNTYEPFDLVELTGNEFSGNIPLIDAEALLDDLRFTTVMNPILYQHLPFEKNISINWRDPALIGIPPKKGVQLSENYINALEQGDYSSAKVSQSFPYIYDVFSYYKGDYYTIQNRLANQYSGKLPYVADPIKHIIVSLLTSIPSGQYNVLLQYQLPDKQKSTSAVIPFQYQW